MNNYPMNFSAEPLIFDSQLGYVTQSRLDKRKLRKDINCLSFITMGTFVASIVGAIIILIITVLPVAISSGFIEPQLELSTELFYLLSGFLTVLGIGLPFIVFLSIRSSKVEKYLSFKKIDPGSFVLFTLAGVGLCMLMNIPVGILSEMMEGIGISSPETVMPPITTPLAMILAFFSTALLPAVFEEFAFRGILLSALRKYGDAFAIVTSSIIFAIIHTSLAATPFALAAGLIMGYIYVRTGNLAISILIHFMNNAVAVVMNEFSLTEEAKGIMMLAIIAIGIVMVIILGVTRKLRFNFNKGSVKLNGTQKLLAVISNPGFIVLALTCVTLTVVTLTQTLL